MTARCSHTGDHGWPDAAFDRVLSSASNPLCCSCAAISWYCSVLPASLLSAESDQYSGFAPLHLFYQLNRFELRYVLRIRFLTLTEITF